MSPSPPRASPGRSPRRRDALSRERIVDAAVELLDTAGTEGLTSRALTERFATGPGAIHHHVGNRDDLLAAATDAVVADALSTARAPDAGSAVHATALGLYRAIEAHPWLAPQIAAQLAQRPWGSLAPRILGSLGQAVRALGVPERRWFTATSSLMHYVLGAAALNAANVAQARTLAPGLDRDHYLGTVARAWEELDPDEPVLRTLAGQLRAHDDRTEFLAGLDVVVRGITAYDPESDLDH